MTLFAQDGRTPLLCCTNGDGAIDVARLLLAAKANTAATWAKKVFSPLFWCRPTSEFRISQNNLTALDLAVRANGQDELETLLRERACPPSTAD